MNTLTTRRRVSPLTKLDGELVKGLCDLHPWDLGRLCREVDLDRTVLSHFFAGRRPLPKKVAKAFLGQIGLRLSGEIDPRHCFVIYPRMGKEDLATEWIGRMFPNGGKRIDLSTEWVNHGRAQQDPDLRAYGSALFDGRIAVVFHESGESDGPITLPGKWDLVDYNNSAEGLLSIGVLPRKDDVMRAFANADFLGETTWEQVRIQAVASGLSPFDVLQLIQRHDAALASTNLKSASA